MSADKPLISVVIPVLNERGEIEATLGSVREASGRAGFGVEVIAVDGGSHDGTREWLQGQPGVVFVASGAGRAKQMNAGAEAARGRWLLFLHADTRLEPDHFERVAEVVQGRGGGVYAFGLKFRHEAAIFRRMERGVAWRTRTFGLPYGDQAFLMERSRFEAAEGFRPGVALEDVDLVLRLRSAGVCFTMLPATVGTSARQYEREGFVEGIALNAGRLFAALCVYFLNGGHFEARRHGGVEPTNQKAALPR
jgi:rSAM/selenodomain-associated transferase 2